MAKCGRGGCTNKLTFDRQRLGDGGVSQIGQIFSNQFASSDWTIEGSNTSWSFGSSIGSIGTSSTYTSLIRYNKWFIQSERFTMQALITVNSVSANDGFFSIGLAGVSTFSTKTNFQCAYFSQSGANNGFMEIYSFNGTSVANSGSGRLTCVAGDQIELTFQLDVNVFTFSARNMNNPTVYQTVTYTNSTGIVYPGSVPTLLPNINQMAFNNYYGNYTVNSFSYTDNQYRNVDITIVGDSKSEGYYVDTIANRFSNLLEWKRGCKVQVAAGSGNTTQDILNALPEVLRQSPKQVVLYVGRNDIANSVPTATWQANYASIVSQLSAAGITVYHQLPTPETVLNQTALTNYINATYSNVISVPSTWDNATDLAPDGAHLSIEGADKIYKNINSVIPACNASFSPALQSNLQTWYDSLSVKPSDTLLNDLNEMFQGMENDGDLINLDFIHPYGGLETNEQRLRPIKTTGTSPMINVNSVTTDVNGFTGNGTTGRIRTGYNPATNGVKYTQDVSSIGIYNKTNRAANGTAICGASQTAPSVKLTRIYPRFTGNLLIYSVNALTESTDANSNSHGYILAVRTLLNLTTGYRNGVSIGTETDTSTSILSAEFYICGVNNGGALLDPTTDNSALFLAGGNISASRTNFRIRKYMTARGINV